MQTRFSGCVVDTREAALRSVRHTDSVENAVLPAASRATAPDSVAATAGQLAGPLFAQAPVRAGPCSRRPLFTQAPPRGEVA